MDEIKINSIAKDINEFLHSLESKYSIKFSKGRATYDQYSAEFSISFYENKYDKYAIKYLSTFKNYPGYTEEMLNHIFNINDQKLKFRGWKSGKYCMVFETESGELTACTEHPTKELMVESMLNECL